ncbi:hypothetical protein AAFH68_11110 [Flavobacterium sp. CGRL1]|jgi:hypothetical protein
MKKVIIISIIALIIIMCFCWNRKTEFIQSKVRTNLFLIKNPPKEDSLLKKEITLFLIKNPPKKNSFPKLFYKYNADTEYFLEHKEESGGFSSQEISMYDDDSMLAVFSMLKCSNDSTKRFGELRLYNNFYEPDTIIYKCD